jgi:sulfite reductase (NADPH) flavoprotein alpha-component
MIDSPATLPLPAAQLLPIDKLAAELDASSLLWLSGYLAGIARARGVDPAALFAAGAQPASNEARRADPTVRATLLYASQTGNGRRIAEKLAQTAEASGLAVRLVSAADYPPRELANERLLFIVTSTHGDGEAPDDLRAFLEHVNGRRAPRLEKLGFAVLALGDSSYPQFCATGRSLDERLAALGGRRLAPREDLDVDYAAPAAAWSERAIGLLRTELAELGAPRLTLVSNAARSTPQIGSPQQPLAFDLLVNQRITGRGSDKDVRHIELAAPGGELPYEPGDALGVWPVNPPETVAGILEVTGLAADLPVNIDGRERPLGEWLTSEREITRLARPLIEAQAQRRPDAELSKLLAADGGEALRQALARWQVVDLLARAPGSWDAPSLVRALRPLTPRLYSIASSPLTVGAEAHLTVAVVDYQFGGARRFGAASRHLASTADGAVRGYLEPNPRFRLPADTDRDIIMIGPGTGVAPFRGFLQHRIAAGARGRNWLFFGARHLTSDFLYQAEWLAALKQGTLHRLDVAFSRDTAERIYVQQRMREQGAELWRWLEAGAHIYVCGDAQHMAHDVHAALIDVVATHGGKDPQSAAAHVDSLLAARRYARDIY